ncbi:MAG TPA: hypothetical protein VK067_04095 [Pseudogracilibacillus sp.]|nr:hypothetical protein [Pseudogracilibacillus sp.]
MTSFLLIISFLLHIILLTAVFQLHQQLQKTKKQTNDEIEEVLSLFLEEIKMENEQLKGMLSQSKVENKPQVQQETVEKKAGATKQAVEISNDVEPPILPIDTLINKQQDVVEQTVESRIVSMYEEGLSIEEIAKQLHRGKTEVALIVKMYQK